MSSKSSATIRETTEAVSRRLATIGRKVSDQEINSMCQNKIWCLTPIGAPGGSQVANDELARFFQNKKSTSKSADLIAKIVKCFEGRKHNLNLHDLNNEGLELGTHSIDSLQLTEPDLKEILESAFRRTLNITNDTMGHMLEQNDNFFVTFCGGSYQMPWLRNQVDKMMKVRRVEGQALSKPVTVIWTFLDDFDHQPSRAVSTGAVLAAMWLPDPRVTLHAAAIGVQEIYEEPSGVEKGDDMVQPALVRVS